jgi:Bacteriophage replication gene A protein (GPA)
VRWSQLARVVPATASRDRRLTLTACQGRPRPDYYGCPWCPESAGCELGQEYTLAELAAKGSGNKKIRRAELMTRIAGFERIARHCGHIGWLLTITCPSRFHKGRTVNGWKVLDNPNYDPNENPATAQKYLARVWSRIRAKLHRLGIKLYGFRIAEPQHDGTPHWHLLVFMESAHEPVVREVVSHYALQDSPNEKGADEHRCNIRVIDWEKGTAAGYIAKYVSKNIDGYQVGKDFYGNDAVVASARVEAWAATWGIRQFQQVGGPPVGVWRELRRIETLPNGAPSHLVQAHRAVNKLAVIEGKENACVAWDHYCEAQGGVFCGRDARIKLSQVQGDKPGRYGDEPPLRPVGVETLATVDWPVPWMPGQFFRQQVLWEIESARHEWEIVRAPNAALIERVSIAEGAEPSPLGLVSITVRSALLRTRRKQLMMVPAPRNDIS